MTDLPDENTDIKDTDIVFDCPHCGKSLAIDYRGAGLAIPCTDCGNPVEVPIPSGMDISDLDDSEEDKEIRILNLRRIIAQSEARIAELESELESVYERRETLEKLRSENMYRFGRITEKVDEIQSAMKTVNAALDVIMDAAIKAEESAPPPAEPEKDKTAGNGRNS